MIDDLGQAIRDGAAWLLDLLGWVMGAFGVLALVAVFVAALVYIAGGVRQALRSCAANQNDAYRDWCDRNQWCDRHDRPDGQCPRIEVVRNPYQYPDDGPRFVECRGSERHR